MAAPIMEFKTNHHQHDPNLHHHGPSQPIVISLQADQSPGAVSSQPAADPKFENWNPWLEDCNPYRDNESCASFDSQNESLCTDEFNQRDSCRVDM